MQLFVGRREYAIFFFFFFLSLRGRQGASESPTGAREMEELIMGRFTFRLDAVVQQLGRTKGRHTIGLLAFWVNYL